MVMNNHFDTSKLAIKLKLSAIKIMIVAIKIGLTEKNNKINKILKKKIFCGRGFFTLTVTFCLNYANNNGVTQ